MNPADVPLPRLRELAHEAIERIGEAKRQTAVVTHDRRRLDLTKILANIGNLQTWVLEQGLLLDRPPNADELANGEQVAEQAGRVAELAEKSATHPGGLNAEERAKLSAVVAFIAEPAERMLIRKRIADELMELCVALNALIGQSERVQSAHATIEALVRRMRS